MSKRTTSPCSLSWSGSSRPVPKSEASRGTVDAISLGVASSPTPTAEKRQGRRGKSAFTERPAVEIRPMEQEADRATRPNGRVKLDRT